MVSGIRRAGVNGVDTTMNKTALLSLFLSATVGTALAQDTTTTVSAAIALGRFSLKLALGPPLGSVESTTDSFSASFVKSVATNVPPTTPPAFTTTGNYTLIHLELPP